MTSELLPCPFCGGEARFARLSGTFGGIKCEGCNAGTDLYASEVTAITAWNTRANASQAEAERLTRERDEARELARSRGVTVLKLTEDGGAHLCRAEAAEARATRAEEEIARRDAVAKASWGDQKDQHTDAILAAHPTNTKDFETYEAALAMVGARHRKYELVNMANWLLARATRAEALVEEAREVLGPFAEAYAFWSDAEGGAHDDVEIDDQGMLTFGHIRAARAFLDKVKGETQ